MHTILKRLLIGTLLVFVTMCFYATPHLLLNSLISAREQSLSPQEIVKEPFLNCVNRASGIVVLGGGSFAEGYPTPTSLSRVLTLVQVLKHIQRHQIINNETWPLVFSGGVTSEYATESEAQVLKKYTFYIDAQDTDGLSVFLDNSSKNTYQNATYTLHIFETHHLQKNIILITNSFHMKRAQMTFEKQGFDVCPVAATSSLLNGGGFLNLNNANNTIALLHEYAGILGYWLKGWI